MSQLTSDAATSEQQEPRHSVRRTSWPAWATPALVFGALIAYPFVMQDSAAHNIGILALTYAIAASGWNLLGGYTGQVSFGHALYFGTGAYVTALLVRAGWSPWLAIDGIDDRTTPRACLTQHGTWTELVAPTGGTYTIESRYALDRGTPCPTVAAG